MTSVRDTTIPRCLTPGCTRTPPMDYEPPGEPGYYSHCDRCSGAYASHPGLHAHRHRYTAVQCAANGYDPAHSWLTSTSLRPVVENDEIVKYVCAERLPTGDPHARGPECPYEISPEDLAVFMEWRAADSLLCHLTILAQSPHYKGDRMELAHEIRAAYVAARIARNKAFPVDVPND